MASTATWPLARWILMVCGPSASRRLNTTRRCWLAAPARLTACQGSSSSRTRMRAARWTDGRHDGHGLTAELADETLGRRSGHQQRAAEGRRGWLGEPSRGREPPGGRAGVLDRQADRDGLADRAVAQAVRGAHPEAVPAAGRHRDRGAPASAGHVAPPPAADLPLQAGGPDGAQPVCRGPLEDRPARLRWRPCRRRRPGRAARGRGSWVRCDPRPAPLVGSRRGPQRSQRPR